MVNPEVPFDRVEEKREKARDAGFTKEEQREVGLKEEKQQTREMKWFKWLKWFKRKRF